MKNQKRHEKAVQCLFPKLLQPEVTGLAYASDGLILLTNDGIFAETLASLPAEGLASD